MCIAIVKTKKGTISDEYLRNSFKNNSNGAGIAYTKDNKLYIIKGIFNEDEFVQAVRDVELIADSNILIHCRISTSGLIDKDNSHPHIVNKNTALIHNGILDIDVPKNSKKSDTVLFIEKYLKDLPTDFINNKAILKLIEDKIGTSNKFCFLNNKGKYAILNEKSGEWVNSVWYSNGTYKYYYESKWNSKGNTYLLGVHNDNYFDFDNDTYQDLYGIDRDEFLETYHLTKSEKLKIIRHIKSLTNEELDMLGDNPIYNIDTETFRREDDYLNTFEFYLDELDYDLMDEYFTAYYTEDEYNYQYI